jgi:hypothetical protein
LHGRFAIFVGGALLGSIYTHTLALLMNGAPSGNHAQHGHHKAAGVSVERKLWFKDAEPGALVFESRGSASLFAPGLRISRSTVSCCVGDGRSCALVTQLAMR